MIGLSLLPPSLRFSPIDVAFMYRWWSYGYVIDRPDVFPRTNQGGDALIGLKLAQECSNFKTVSYRGRRSQTSGQVAVAFLTNYNQSLALKSYLHVLKPHLFNCMFF